MFQGCGLFACVVRRRGADAVRKRGEPGAASSRVAAEPPLGWELEEELELEGSAVAARQMAWADVESATGCFSSRVIGRGGFSTVYLAALSPSRLGAVKVQHCGSERLGRAFRQELGVLLSLRHPHVVRLLGYCDDRDQGVLVFEYAPNGDLHEGLHGGGGNVLPWPRRVAIAFQVAMALEYLHEGSGQARPGVIHGDIKASNVLLDANMDAKLCDFGFAQSSSGGSGRPSGRAIMGSPGYVDPHLLRTGVASKESDVYSFGVLLLELVTGKEAVCRETGQRLAQAVGPAVSEGKVADVVDPRLGRGQRHDAGEAAVIAGLAMRCVGDGPGLRPSMADVVRVLQEKTSAVGSRLDRKMMF